MALSLVKHLTAEAPLISLAMPNTIRYDFSKQERTVWRIEARSSKGRPLGYIQLESGEKPVAVMNDVFLNFQFEKEENWEDLRSIVNIFIKDYASQKPSTVSRPIESAIQVQTQYKFLLNPENKTRNQDFKMTGEQLTYVEFQNRAYNEPPIETRASEYFGLGIGHSGGKLSNQIWLLAEEVRSVLAGEVYANYILIDEVTSAKYPKPSGLMFVSLSGLAGENTAAGELASLLLGLVTEPEAIKDEEVRRVAKGIRAGFGKFKEDKEVKRIMTVKERFLNEGRIEGRTEGRIEGRTEGRTEGVVQSAATLIRKGKSDFQGAVELLDLTKEQADQLAEMLGNQPA
jgi:hypothetical protein